MLRCAKVPALMLLLCGFCGDLAASELDEAVALKDEAMEILRANARQVAAPEVYAGAIRKLQRAEDLLEEFSKSDPDRAAPLQREVASARFWAQRFANVNVADALRNGKEAAAKDSKPGPKDSKPLDEKKPATPPAETAVKTPPANVKPQSETAVSAAEKLDKAAAQLMKEGKHAEAAEKLVQALAKNPAAKTNTIAQFGDYCTQLGQNAAALVYYKLLVQESEKRGADEALLAIDLDKLATCYVTLSRNAEAEPLLKRVLAIREKFYGAEHLEVADTLALLGHCQMSLNKFPLAESTCKRALEMRGKLGNANAIEVAVIHVTLGTLYETQGKYKEAEEQLQQALEIGLAAYGTKYFKIAYYYTVLGGLKLRLGKVSEAKELLEKAMKLADTKAAGYEHPFLGTILQLTAALYFRMDAPETKRAKLLYERALAIFARTDGAESLKAAEALNGLAMMYFVDKNYERAEEFGVRSINIYKKMYGENDVRVGRAGIYIGDIYTMQQKYDKARPFYEKAYETTKATYGAEHPETIRRLANVGFLHYNIGEFEKSAEIFAEALKLAEKKLPAGDTIFDDILRGNALSMRKLNRVADAEKIEARMKARPKPPQIMK